MKRQSPNPFYHLQTTIFTLQTHSTMLTRTTIRLPTRALVQQQQQRLISSTSSNNGVLDYFKFFNKSKSQTEELSEVKPQKTEEKIKEIEHKEAPIELEQKIEILGKAQSQASLIYKQELQKNLNGFKIHSWIPKNSLYSKKLAELESKSSSSDAQARPAYQQAITELLSEITSKFYPDASPASSIALDELHTRFALLKEIQRKFGIVIPDIKIGSLTTTAQLESYLFARLNPANIALASEKDELLPSNAIVLDAAKFEGSNVSVGEWVFEKQKAKSFKKLLKKANELEKVQFEEHQKSNKVGVVA
ncbi:unnamed protein product [Ambrosiozyma monospora]|uniref:Large ribosomal subunit protein mL50 n=1 Tax=Ambrosiozyma monospora TaxID=43982 RepID=A0A9W7DHN6_AMBMO|nr:unnamed protein product [Ambrosiozyma monospora]